MYDLGQGRKSTVGYVEEVRIKVVKESLPYGSVNWRKRLSHDVGAGGE